MESRVATFGSGCFWCGQALFKNLKGVSSVTVGYSGGSKPNPTYEEVCSGKTGHAEVFQIEFDPSIITYKQLVEIFFLTHDPTQMNRQGNDIGEQYRSEVFHHDEEQKKVAEEVKEDLEKEKVFDKPIVTQILPAKNFYPAESYHQDYYAKNSEAGYCQMVIDPKVAEFHKKFTDLLKSSLS